MSVVAASGFRAAGMSAGIKPSGDPDLSLIVADGTVPGAAVFTTSVTAAPPVTVSREHVSSGAIRAVIVNSGGANAGTGEAGEQDARAMAASVAAHIGCTPQEVFVCSTGPIGGRLPLDRITGAVPALVDDLGRDRHHALAVAEGILTTDSVVKMATVEGPGWTVGGIAKGAGMLRPDMATMLAFVTTDAALDAGALSDALVPAVEVTFNALDVDGCQSTNDTVLVLASGGSGVVPPPGAFPAALEQVCRDLAFQIARDAEGAGRVVTLDVSGAVDDRSARRIGRAVADSALVRASFYGADPNWGRVIAALGVTGEKVDPSRVRIGYDGTVVCDGGVGLAFDDEELASRLGGDFTVSIVVGDGAGSAVVTTTDLTPDYVLFNGERS